MGACINDHLSRYGGLAVGREDEQKRYFEQKRLYALQIETTDACHQGCIYCYAGSTPQESYGLASHEIRGLLEDAAALEIRAIDWLGGDPLVRPDWYELMQYARSLGIINNVWTSGLPLKNKQIAAQVNEVTDGGFVSVHVDSITPEVYVQLHRGGNDHYIDAIVEGVNMVSRHTKPNSQNPQGGIVKKEAPVHISNLMLVDPSSGEPTRVGRILKYDNKWARYAKKSGEEIK